jgi:hypothetical protein
MQPEEAVSLILQREDVQSNNLRDNGERENSVGAREIPELHKHRHRATNTSTSFFLPSSLASCNFSCCRIHPVCDVSGAYNGVRITGPYLDSECSSANRKFFHLVFFVLALWEARVMELSLPFISSESHPVFSIL